MYFLGEQANAFRFVDHYFVLQIPTMITILYNWGLAREGGGAVLSQEVIKHNRLFYLKRIISSKIADLTNKKLVHMVGRLFF